MHKITIIKINLFFLLSFLSLLVYGQEKRMYDRVRLIGVVMEQSNLNVLSDVQCRTRDRAVLSNSSGRFFIDVHPGDTITFSYVGYRSFEHIVPDTLFRAEYAIGVFLSHDTILLPEVVVLERTGTTKHAYYQNARRNMSGVGAAALAPKAMDAAMNQKMGIEEFATSIAMKGHVKVGLEVGTQSWNTFQLLKQRNKALKECENLSDLEINLLKKLYNKEK